MQSLELEYRDTLRKAIKTWGEASQIDMLHEEVGELLQAINKHKRKPCFDTVDNLHEEIADVQIMLEQLQLITKGKASVYVKKRDKLERLKKRLET